MDLPQIFNHGAVSCVAGPCHLLLMDNASSLLIDYGLFQQAETSVEGKAGAGRLAIDFPREGISEVEDIIHRKNTAKRRPLPLGEMTAGMQEVGRSMMPESKVRGRFGLQKQPQLDCSSLPIILDPPLASRFTQVYRELDRFWDTEALSRVKRGRSPLAFCNLITVDSHRSRLATFSRRTQAAQPAIVIAGDSMCSSSRIVNCLNAVREDDRPDVLFWGCQAKGTAGRQILRFAHKGGYLEMDEKCYAIRAQVHTIDGYSAHADQKGLTSMRSMAVTSANCARGVPEAKA